MKKRFKIYLVRDKRFQNALIEHFVGHIWLPRSKNSTFSRKLKLPCSISSKWIKERVFLRTRSIKEQDRIIFVDVVRGQHL